MMKKHPNAFVRFVNLSRLISGDKCFDYLAKNQDAILILAHLSASSHESCSVTITNLVQCQSFGSPPTVFRRLAELEYYGLIEFLKSKDKRKKLIILSPLGEMYLVQRAELMERALGELTDGTKLKEA